MEKGWVACPFCGWHQANLINPNLSIMEHAKNTSSGGSEIACSAGGGGSKSKCCHRYKKKAKKGPCKRCPKTNPGGLKTSSIDEVF
ncbi:MAG TPA: hypothetical protein D7H95_04760 [Candidatus Poseidoniales archaeon]|nr:MAG TPA: hypothetical protein D7H95_04760 [Candidatus Poseidoniales archaeon]